MLKPLKTLKTLFKLRFIFLFLFVASCSLTANNNFSERKYTPGYFNNAPIEAIQKITVNDTNTLSNTKDTSYTIKKDTAIIKKQNSFQTPQPFLTHEKPIDTTTLIIRQKIAGNNHDYYNSSSGPSFKTIILTALIILAVIAVIILLFSLFLGFIPFLLYFFNLGNVIITAFYLVFETVVLVKWQDDGNTLSWWLAGFFTAIFLFNLIGESVTFRKK